MYKRQEAETGGAGAAGGGAAFTKQKQAWRKMHTPSMDKSATSGRWESGAGFVPAEQRIPEASDGGGASLHV